MRRRYVVDGLRIETSVAIEGLGDSGSGPIDWHIEVAHEPFSESGAGIEWTGSVAHQGIPWVRYGRRGGDALVLVKGFGAVVASKADRRATVHHDLEDDGDARALRRAMPYLVVLSGGFVLHAACVVVPSGAVLLAGESGAGKSTLALAFDARGVPIFSDDHVALRVDDAGAAQASPSFPSIEVVAGARAFFRPETGSSEDMHEGKVAVLSRTPRPESPLRVVGLCFLRRGSRAAHEPIAGKDVVPLLFHESSFVADPTDLAEHGARFEAATHLAASVPATILRVPDGLDRLASALDDLLAPFVGGLRP